MVGYVPYRCRQSAIASWGFVTRSPSVSRHLCEAPKGRLPLHGAPCVGDNGGVNFCFMVRHWPCLW